MNPAIELSLIVRRYLQHCDRACATNAIAETTLLTCDRHLLANAAYWCGIGHLKPGIGVEIAIDWDSLWSEISENSMPPSDRLSPAEEFIYDLCDYFRTCAHSPSRLVELAATGADLAIVELLLLAPATPVFSEAAAETVSVRLKIDRQQLERIQMYSRTQARELKQHLRLVASGATYDLMKHLTGCTTHEFAALRKIVAIDHPRGRMPKPTPEKLRHIRELISMVCSAGNPPGITEYLELCDHIEHSDLSIGEIHAAQLRVISPDQSSDEGV